MDSRGSSSSAAAQLQDNLSYLGQNEAEKEEESPN